MKPPYKDVEDARAAARAARPNTKNDLEYVTELFHVEPRRAEGWHESSKRVGTWVFENSDGSWIVANYSFGELTGEWFSFSRGGVVLAHGHYDCWMRTGRWRYYSVEGRITAEADYVDDGIVGAFLVYGEHGLIANGTVERDGRGRVEEYNDDGHLVGRGPILMDQVSGVYERNGEWELYEGGQVTASGMLRKNLQTGPWLIDQGGRARLFIPPPFHKS